MLRITTDKNAQTLVLRIEGRLEGPWVAVLEQSWRRALATLRGRRLCVDLNGVTFIDGAGKARLAGMHAGGAELLGGDIETKAIVAEIHACCAGTGDSEFKPVPGLKPAADLADEHRRLLVLQAELHEVNQELAQSTRPLERLAEMHLKERQQLADKIRAGLARW